MKQRLFMLLCDIEYERLENTKFKYGGKVAIEKRIRIELKKGDVFKEVKGSKKILRAYGYNICLSPSEILLRKEMETVFSN